MHAKDLIWWADFRLQDVEKQRERRKTKAKKGRKNKEKETWKHEKLPPFCGGFSWPILTMKLGKRWDCWPKSAHQLGSPPHIYIYQPSRIYPDGLIRGPIFCTTEGWYGALFFFLKISFPPQPEAKKTEKLGCWKHGWYGAPKTGADTAGSVSAVLLLGLRISSWNASHRRTDDWGQTFGKLSKNHTGS